DVGRALQPSNIFQVQPLVRIDVSLASETTTGLPDEPKATPAPKDNHELPGRDLFDPGLSADFDGPFPGVQGGPVTKHAWDGSQDGTLLHSQLEGSLGGGGSSATSDALSPYS